MSFPLLPCHFRVLPPSRALHQSPRKRCQGDCYDRWQNYRKCFYRSLCLPTSDLRFWLLIPSQCLNSVHVGSDGVELRARRHGRIRNRKPPHRHCCPYSRLDDALARALRKAIRKVHDFTYRGTSCTQHEWDRGLSSHIALSKSKDNSRLTGWTHLLTRRSFHSQAEPSAEIQRQLSAAPDHSNGRFGKAPRQKASHSCFACHKDCIRKALHSHLACQEKCIKARASIALSQHLTMAPFNPAQDIGDLSSKVALVTGGNAGIGKATVEALAVHKPACIYICARNLPTAQTLVDKLQKSCPDTKLQILELDLASLESVKKCASDFIAKSDRLDLLFLNAGVGTMVPKVTNEGYEVCFGVNHMGHALLTQLLLPKMLQTKEHDHSADLRIVATSSVGAYRFAPKAGIDVSQMTNAKAFGDGLMARYGHSKLANVLFTRKLAELYPSITTTSVHPGTVKSEIFERARQEGSTMMYWLTYPVVALTGVTVEEGAKTQLWAGTAPGVKTGGYYEPVGKPVEKPVFNDSKQVEALWKYTEHELSRHGAPGWPNL